jgi:colicin import membrane protein
MTTRLAYLEFAPPPTRGLLRGVTLAIVVHGFLLAGLAVGVHWKREAPIVVAEAELWSAVPQDAAPPAPLPPPVPEVAPEPPPEVKPEPAPEPVVTPPSPDPSIAIARDKAKQRKEQQQRELLEKEKQLKDKQKADKAAADKQEKAKTLKAKELKEAKEAQAAKDLKAAKDAKAKPAESAVDAKKLADLRLQNLKRMAGLAAGSGNDSSQGTAAQSSGPSAGYAGRIRARIKPNITFTDTISGNPTAEVEVRTSPDGTIISRRLTQSSGVKSWDDAVLAAIDKSEVLPRDVDGRVPPALVISFRPRD